MKIHVRTWAQLLWRLCVTHKIGKGCEGVHFVFMLKLGVGEAFASFYSSMRSEVHFY